MSNGGEPLTPERLIKQQIRRYLLSLPNSWWEFSTPGSVSGKPDIVGCYHGRFVAFEVKTKVGVVTKLQSYTLEKMREAGGVVSVVRSVEAVQMTMGAMN